MFKKLKQIFSKKENKHPQPEDAYKTTITKDYISVEHPKRATELIRWEEIEEIFLINTDEGPFMPDIWLILSGKGKGCSLPQGSEGFERVYDIVSKYSEFNFESFIESMSCTESKQFILWQKK